MPKRDPALKKLAQSVKNSLNDDEKNGMTQIVLGFLHDGLVSLTDTRQSGKVKHLIGDCVGIVLFSLFSDVDEWIEMEMFANDNLDVLKNYLELPNGVPSHDTIERVMQIVNVNELDNILDEVLRSTIQQASKTKGAIYRNDDLGIVIDDVIAVDGKEIRNTGNPRKKDIEDQRNFNMLNVQSTETGITLSATKINEKSNEIPEAQKVLKGLQLKGSVVTADALNTQKETARVIIEEAHADYCLAVKSNQKMLYDEIALYFSDEYLLKCIKEKNGCYLKETEETTYKVTTREYYITDDIAWYDDRKNWKALKSFGCEKKTVVNKEDGAITSESRYFICSIMPVAELFAIVVRRHWHVENLLHWVLDVVFKEDHLHTREKNALLNLAKIKRFVLSVLKILKPYYNMSFRYMRRKIGRNFAKEIPVIFSALKVMYDMGQQNH